MWKRIVILLIIATFLLLAGWLLLPALFGGSSTPTATRTASALLSTSSTSDLRSPLSTDIAVQSSEAPTQVSPTSTPTTQLATTSTPTSMPVTAVPQRDLALSTRDVRLFPVPQIYAGERVTFQLFPRVPDFLKAEDIEVEVLVDGQTVSREMLGRRNLGGRVEGLLEWAWQTAVQPATHEVEIVLDPDDNITVGDENLANNGVTLSVRLLDPKAMPHVEANATWIAAETNCCRVHALSGTAANRDLPQLLRTVETAVQHASFKLNETPRHKIDIYFIDRVIGQGGFTGAKMAISYLDRQYVGGGLHEILTHEAVHIIDQQFAPQRIPFLAEGVAVWASEGHYKPENLDERSAALLSLNQYIPLDRLINDFYPVQHEIAYLQAAGFVTYLIDNFGWELFRDFYSATTVEDAPMQATAVDSNLQLYYGSSLAEMEANWLAHLRSLNPSNQTITDLDTTLRFYNLMRRYQLLYDPTAYYLTAWFPAPDSVEKSGNPADLSRHPQTELNITLELMLLAAVTELQLADYGRANIIMDSIVRVLNNNGAFIDPLANSYLGIVQAVTAAGYLPHQVELFGETADVRVTTERNNNLQRLTLSLRPRGWIILPK